MWGLDHDGNYKKKNATLSSYLWYQMMSLLAEQDATISVEDIILNELKQLYEKSRKEKRHFILSSRSEKEKGKRLLYLFQKDLLPGINGLILESKNNRDSLTSSSSSSSSSGFSIKGRSKIMKVIAWSFLTISNSLMLFYIFLFALSQDTANQKAWGQSFALWLVLEIIIIGTLTVLIMHVWIPSFSMKDIISIQKRLTETVTSYQKKMEEEKLTKEANTAKRYSLVQKKVKKNLGSKPLHEKEEEEEEEGVEDSDGDITLSDDSDDDEEEEDDEIGASQRSSFVVSKGRKKKDEPFNAAKYLFLSNSVASLFPEHTIAKIVLNFSSPWPKQSYQYLNNISASYEQSSSGVSRSSSIILLFFLSSLLSMPLPIQDILMNITSTTVIGYTFLLHYQLYRISPGMIVVPVLGLVALLFVGRVIQLRSRKTQNLAEEEKMKSAGLVVMEGKEGSSGNTLRHANKLDGVSNTFVQPSVPNNRKSVVSTSASHKTRRASVKEGIQAAHLMKDVLQEVKLNEGNEKEADNAEEKDSLDDLSNDSVFSQPSPDSDKLDFTYENDQDDLRSVDKSKKNEGDDDDFENLSDFSEDEDEDEESR
jgi:hypothetical protein